MPPSAIRIDLTIIGMAAFLALAAPARADGEIGLRGSGGEISPARAGAPADWAGPRRSGFEEPAASGAAPVARARREAATSPEPAERRPSRNVQYIVFDQGWTRC